MIISYMYICLKNIFPFILSILPIRFATLIPSTKNLLIQKIVAERPSHQTDYQQQYAFANTPFTYTLYSDCTLQRQSFVPFRNNNLIS